MREGTGWWRRGKLNEMFHLKNRTKLLFHLESLTRNIAKSSGLKTPVNSQYYVAFQWNPFSQLYKQLISLFMIKIKLLLFYSCLFLSVMKHTSLLLLLFCFSLNGLSQTIVKKHLSSCDKNAIPDYLKNRITDKQLSNDTLYLTVGFTGNCSMSLRPTLTASNDTLFLALTNISDMRAMCDCCYELELTVVDVPNKDFVLVYPHKYWFFDRNTGEEKDSLLNEVLTEQPNKFIFPLEEEFNNIKSHNQFTPEGLKTGLWYKYDTTRVRLRKVITLKHAIFFSPPKAGKSEALWSVHFKDDGTISGVSVYNSYQNSWMEIDGPMYYRLIGKTE